MNSRKTIFKLFLVVIIALNNTGLYAQNVRKTDLALSAHGWYGYDIEQSRPNLASLGYMNYEMSVGFQTNPADSCCYAQAFGYPMISVGLSLARTSNFKFYDKTKLPDLYTAFGSFERSIIRRKHFSFGYLLDFGVTYNPGRYDPVNNPGNNWLSSPIMAYFGAGALVKYHFGKRWEIGVDLMFRHFSNGRLELPKEALNGLGAGLFARYRLEDYDYKRYSDVPRIRAEYKKGMQYMIVLGTGFHTCWLNGMLMLKRNRILSRRKI